MVTPEDGHPTQRLSPIAPDRPQVIHQQRICEMDHWRIECVNGGQPRNRWVCELLCKTGYRHDIFLTGSFRRALSHARRFERAAHEEGLMPEAPLPVLNLKTGVLTWPDGRAEELPGRLVPQSTSPRGHLRLV